MTATENPIQQTETPDHRLRLPALVEYRAAAAKRRAEAFCLVPEYVLGIRLRPMTPATFTMLRAIGSHFVCGGDITEGDVRNFIWFHSPDYVDASVPGWRKRKARCLAPLNRQLAGPLCRWFGRRPEPMRYAATMALAISDIRQIVEDAFADLPAANGADSAPLACLEANLIHSFSKGYGWPAERTRQMPLKQLFQLLRCLLKSAGETVNDDGEQRILAAHLARRQAAINAGAKSNG